MRFDKQNYIALTVQLERFLSDLMVSYERMAVLEIADFQKQQMSATPYLRTFDFLRTGKPVDHCNGRIHPCLTFRKQRVLQCKDSIYCA